MLRFYILIASVTNFNFTVLQRYAQVSVWIYYTKSVTFSRQVLMLKSIFLILWLFILQYDVVTVRLLCEQFTTPKCHKHEQKTKDAK